MDEKVTQAPAEERTEKPKVASGKKRKKTLSKRFRETFLAEDIHNVGDFVFFDVIVPAIQDMIVNTIQDSVNRLVYGSSSRRPYGGFNGSQSRAPRTSYASAYSSRPVSQQPTHERRPDRRDAFFTDIEFDNRGEAEAVLMSMRDDIAHYGICTVMDMCDHSGVTATWTDRNYGWNNLDSARVRNVRGGFIIDLPKPAPID